MMNYSFENVRSDLYTAILNKFDANDLKIIFDNYIDSNSGILGNHAYKFVSNVNRDWVVQCSDVLTHVYQNDLVPYLISELQAARPNTDVFSKILQDSQIGVFEDSNQAMSLQRYIRESQTQDPYVFISKIMKATRQTCLLIGRDDILGTGFLVSNDNILTNYHVYESAILAGENPEDIKAVFDYAKASDGRTVNFGVERKFDNSFSRVSSPVSSGRKFDEEPKKLDYTYLKLQTGIGAEQVSSTHGVDEVRGYFHMSGSENRLGDDEDIFVFHHPEGGAVKCSPGQFESYFESSEDPELRSRVRYDATTLDGSSGGAVLNGNFDLVALHHAGDGANPPQFNQGIPIHLIKKDIDRQLAERNDS